MKHKVMKRFALIVLLFWVVAPCFADATCSLNLPPLEAAVSGNHGQYLFVFPRKVPPSFSGCQIMWDEQGKKVFVLRFSRGNLYEYSVAAPSSSPTEFVCKYNYGRLTANSSKECSAYEDVKDGLLNVDPADEPSVPKERDARLKHANPSNQPDR